MVFIFIFFCLKIKTFQQTYYCYTFIKQKDPGLLYIRLLCRGRQWQNLFIAVKHYTYIPIYNSNLIPVNFVGQCFGEDPGRQKISKYNTYTVGVSRL